MTVVWNKGIMEGQSAMGGPGVCRARAREAKTETVEKRRREQAILEAGK